MTRLAGCIALISCILLCSGCPGSSCIEARYSFTATSQITPDYDSIRIGDTIMLVSFIPIQLQDRISGSTVSYSNSKTISSNLSIGRLENNNSIPIDAVWDFDYFSVKGNIYNDKNIPSPNGVQQLAYEETGTGYQLKVGIIAKQKGVFTFGIGNGLSNGRREGHSCEKASFGISISNTTQHVYYYELWRTDYILTSNDLQRIYCFKVY